MLLGLNCGLRCADISDIKKSNVDFKNQYFSKPRTKSGIIQSSILWQETIEALKQYIKEFPNYDSEYLFTTINNNKYTYQYLIDYHYNQLRCSGADILHKVLRISANSIANRYNCSRDAIKIFMGWSISHVDNSYNDRHCEATREVCNAVYDFYFGGEK